MTNQMGPIGQIAGTVMDAVGQIAGGAGKAEAYQYNADVERAQSREALTQSYFKAAQQARAAAATGGQARAAYGAAGVAPSGSALHVMNDIAAQGEMARQLALYQGRVEATGHEREADVQHEQANQARIGSYIGAAGTLLGQAGGQAASAFSPSSVNANDWFVKVTPGIGTATV